MQRLVYVFVLAVMMIVVSCASEAPEVQKLYTDAKSMWDEVNKAFTLPKGEERTLAMNKFISEKYDEKIVGSLSQYLSQAPSGKYAADAKKLMEEARSSQALRAFAQMRPMLQNQALPKTPEEADSLAARWQREQQGGIDTTSGAGSGQ